MERRGKGEKKGEEAFIFHQPADLQTDNQITGLFLSPVLDQQVSKGVVFVKVALCVYVCER